MTGKSEPTPRDFADDPEDEAPDLSAPEWQEKFARARVRRGRPKSPGAKINTTIRLSPEVIAHFKAGGPGWQTRIDEALRKLAGL